MELLMEKCLFSNLPILQFIQFHYFHPNSDTINRGKPQTKWKKPITYVSKLTTMITLNTELLMEKCPFSNLPILQFSQFHYFDPNSDTINREKPQRKWKRAIICVSKLTTKIASNTEFSIKKCAFPNSQ